MTIYTIYTSGACLNNGRPNAKTGWGAVLTNPKGITLELAGAVPEKEPQTNIRAELMAVVEALESCTQAAPIILYTNSEYITKALQGRLANWKAKGWRKADKKPPEHVDLWQRVDQLLHRKDVTACWVKAHSGILGNGRADTLAILGAAGETLRRCTKRSQGRA